MIEPKGQGYLPFFHVLPVAARRTLIICILLFVCVAEAKALDVPKFRGFVNDYANMISADTKAQIEVDLRALEQSDSTQIFVLTVPSLEGEGLEEFAIKVFDEWKAGQKGLDNGVILIVAQKERKIRIEVGRGLEGKLTDLAAGRIIDLVIKPKFKDGDFNGGFLEGVSALVQATKGEFKGEGNEGVVKPAEKAPYQDTPLDKLCGIIFMPFSFLEALMGFLIQRPGRWDWFLFLSGLLLFLFGTAIFSDPVRGRRLRIISGAVVMPVFALLTVWDPLSSEPSAGNPFLVLLCYTFAGGIMGAFSRRLYELVQRLRSRGSGSSSSSSGGGSSSSSGGGGGSSGGGGASGGY